MANEWGIPELDVSLSMTELAMPCVAYGSISRTAPMPGTFHFYTDDYRFSRLIHHPARILASMPRAAIEANFSTGPHTSRAESLFGVFLRRRLSTLWQEWGLRIAVDLNLHDDVMDLALLGVPIGWPSYATRTHRRTSIADTEDRFNLAVSHSRVSNPLFIVVGGGKPVKDACRERDWVYVPEHMRIVDGK